MVGVVTMEGAVTKPAKDCADRASDRVFVDGSSGLPTPQRYWAVAAISTGIGLSVIDGFIVNIALPTIAEDFAITASQSVLIVNAYQLTATMALLPLAALGDKIGYRRIYHTGFVLFILASLCCAAASNLISLTAARALQGLGAAGIMCVGTALIRSVYPASLLGRGLGINAVVVAASSAAGPSLGGLVLAMSSWQWLFLINIPVGLAGLALGLKHLPWNRPVQTPFDFISALLSVLTFGSILFLIDCIGHGQGIIYLIPLGVFALVVGREFVRRQLASRAPILPVDLLRNPLFFLSVMTAITYFCAQMLTFVSLPFFLSLRLHMDAASIGMVFTAWPLAVMCTALLAGRLADRYSAGVLGGIGLTVGAIGLFLLDDLAEHHTVFDIVWRLGLCGAGFGLFQIPNTRFMVGTAPRNRAGSVSGMLGTIRLTGHTIGASLAALMLNIFNGQAQSGLHLALALACLAAVFSSARLCKRFNDAANPAIK